MPRVRRNKKRQTGWTEATVFILKTGRDYFGQHSDERDELDLITLYQAWQDLRSEILPQWLKDHAGSRPWGWWQFDRPVKSRRERVDGRRHPFDDPTYDAPRELSFGIPRFWRESDLPAGGTENISGAFESESDFLRRNSLLSPAEQQVLRMEN